MSIRAAIYDLLNDSEADVYPFVSPQELADPYVVFNIRMAPERVQEGTAVKEVDLTLNIFANTLELCTALAATMYAGLEDASGTYDTETLHVSNWVSEDGYYIDDLQKYVITQEYQLKFTYI